MTFGDQARIQELNDREAEITETLQKLLRKEPSKITLGLPNPTGLLQVIEKTDVMASKISAKIRTLEQQMVAANEAIQILLNIKECRQNLVKLENSDLHASCQILYDTLKFLPSISDLCPEETRKLERFKLVALETLDQKTEELIATGNDEFLQYLRLFTMLDEVELGLDRYSNYIKVKIYSTLESRQDKDKVSVLMRLSSLFEIVATTIERNQKNAHQVFGSRVFLYVLRRLQNEVDIKSSIIIEEFIQKSKLESTVKDCSKGLVEMKELDKLTNEMVIMVQKCIMFDKFIRAKARLELDGSYSGSASQNVQQDLPMVTVLNEKVQYLISQLVVLLVAFLQKSIVKSKEMEKKEVNVKVSSSIDDSFYVTKLILERCFRVGDCDLTCALLNGVSRILEDDFIGPMLKQLSTSFAKSNQDSKVILLLNNVDTCCSYISQLSDDTQNKLELVYTEYSPLQKEQIKSCLFILLDYAQRTKQTLKTYLEVYFQNNIKSKIRNLLFCFTEEKYNLAESEYTAFEQSDVHRIPALVKSELAKIQSGNEKNFTTDNYHYLLGLSMQTLSQEIEQKLYTFKFTLFGALKLDIQLRGIISKLSQEFDHVREHFQKLSQIVMLLNLESTDDFVDVYRGGSRFKLSISEIKKVLGQRCFILIRTDLNGTADNIQI